MIFNILHNYCLTFHYSSVQFRCKGVWNNWSNCRWGPFRQCWRCCIMYPYNRPSKDRCFIFKMHCLQLLKVAEWRWQGPFSTPAPAVSQLLLRCRSCSHGVAVAPAVSQLPPQCHSRSPVFQLLPGCRSCSRGVAVAPALSQLLPRCHSCPRGVAVAPAVSQLLLRCRSCPRGVAAASAVSHLLPRCRRCSRGVAVAPAVL